MILHPIEFTPELDVREIKSLELSIHGLTQNDFTTLERTITAIDGDTLTVKDNAFLGGDSVIVEAMGVPKRLYYVLSSDGDEVVIDFNSRVKNDKLNKSRIKLVQYPQDVIEGARNVIEEQRRIAKNEKRGIKSESIGRMSITYADESELINGVDPKFFSFLEPYRKFGWD